MSRHGSVAIFIRVLIGQFFFLFPLLFSASSFSLTIAKTGFNNHPLVIILISNMGRRSIYTTVDEKRTAQTERNRQLTLNQDQHGLKNKKDRERQQRNRGWEN